MATQSESIKAAVTEIGTDVAALKTLAEKLVQAHEAQVSYAKAVITAMATGSAASAASESDGTSEAASEEEVDPNKYFQVEESE